MALRHFHLLASLRSPAPCITIGPMQLGTSSNAPTASGVMHAYTTHAIEHHMCLTVHRPAVSMRHTSKGRSALGHTHNGRTQKTCTAPNQFVSIHSPASSPWSSSRAHQANSAAGRVPLPTTCRSWPSAPYVLPHNTSFISPTALVEAPPGMALRTRRRERINVGEEVMGLATKPTYIYTRDDAQECTQSTQCYA